MLGGGGLVAANVYASATEGGDSAQQSSDQDGWTKSAQGGTIDCPDVGSELTTVPEEAKQDVARELALLDQQIAEAYQRLQESAQAVRQDASFADSAIMNPLKEKRTATIERIAIAVDRVGERPEGLEALASCTLRPADPGTADDGNGAQDQNGGDNDQSGADQGGQQDGGAGQAGAGGQAGNGPVAADFTDITTVQPNVQAPQLQADASRGTFSTSCGVNENGLFNSDNVIVAPGVSNGAHHFHDYVGNQSNTAFASDDDLADAETSCVDQGDKSTYYWPVIRLQNGTQEKDANSPGGGIEGNAGEIVTPQQVTLTFVGSPRGKVTEMPRLLRIITGDAKAFVNGPANANASWSCTGFEDRQLKDKYPLCPQGSDVVRTFKFQSCWDGRNIDSANHRTHVAFAAADGSCPNGFTAIPQLVQRIVYDVDAPSLQDGGRTTPLFAVDSFPEQQHKPVTDHGDFINVFDEDLMKEMVDCINAGRQCGAGAGSGADDGSGTGNGSGSDEGSGSDDGSGSDQGSGSGDDSGSGATEEPTKAPDNPPAGNEEPGKDGGADEQTTPPTADEPETDPADGGVPTAASTAKPRTYVTPKAKDNAATAPAQGGDTQDDDSAEGATPTQAETQTQGVTGGQSVAGSQPVAGSQTEPQTAGGGLAETGANLWPAMAGAVLLIAGFLLLRSTKRRPM
jgi:hypothetical protein